MLNVLVKVTIHANKTYEQYTEMEKILLMETLLVACQSLFRIFKGF